MAKKINGKKQDNRTNKYKKIFKLSLNIFHYSFKITYIKSILRRLCNKVQEEHPEFTYIL